MQYVLIFDVAESGFRNWWFPAVGLIFVAVGIFLVKNRKILPYMFPGQMGPKMESSFDSSSWPAPFCGLRSHFEVPGSTTLPYEMR